MGLDARPHHVMQGEELSNQYALECMGTQLAAAQPGSGEFSLLVFERTARMEAMVARKVRSGKREGKW
jgi:hypothetical protein